MPLQSEINIHFPREIGLDVASVLLYPELVVCLDRGIAEFSISEAELHLLAETLRNRLKADSSQPFTANEPWLMPGF